MYRKRNFTGHSSSKKWAVSWWTKRPVYYCMEFIKNPDIHLATDKHSTWKVTFKHQYLQRQTHYSFPLIAIFFFCICIFYYLTMHIMMDLLLFIELNAYYKQKCDTEQNNFCSKELVNQTQENTGKRTKGHYTCPRVKGHYNTHLKGS